MKSATTTAVSGCLVWIITFCLLCSCLLPILLPVAGFTSTNGFAVDILAPYLCPRESTAEIITHQTTSVDSSGFSRPSTAYEMQCVASTGSVVREPSPDYAFIWYGILAIIGLILSALIAFLLAAPAGVLIGKLVNRLRKPSPLENKV